MAGGGGWSLGELAADSAVEGLEGLEALEALGGFEGLEGLGSEVAVAGEVAAIEVARARLLTSMHQACGHLDP